MELGDRRGSASVDLRRRGGDPQERRGTSAFGGDELTVGKDSLETEKGVREIKHTPFLFVAFDHELRWLPGQDSNLD